MLPLRQGSVHWPVALTKRPGQSYYETVQFVCLTGRPADDRVVAWRGVATVPPSGVRHSVAIKFEYLRNIPEYSNVNHLIWAARCSDSKYPDKDLVQL